jgi:hypothetical protein
MKRMLIALFFMADLCVSARADNITVVWQAQRAIFCETDWIKELLANPTLLEQYRVACHQWWLDYKGKLKEDLSTVIKNTLAC